MSKKPLTCVPGTARSRECNCCWDLDLCDENEVVIGTVFLSAGVLAILRRATLQAKADADSDTIGQTMGSA